jgi:WD40 repeat protein
VSPDGRWVATAAWTSVRDEDARAAGGIKIWEAQSGKLARELNTDAQRATVAFSPDGRRLVSGTPAGFTFWEVGSWQLLPDFSQPGDVGTVPSTVVVSSADGKILALRTSHDVVQLVNAATGRPFATLQPPHQDYISWLGIPPDGSKLVMHLRTHPCIGIWDLRAIRSGLADLGLDWDLPPYPPSSPGDANPSRGAADGGELCRVLTGHTGEVYSVGFSSDSRLAVSASLDGTLRAWDVPTGKELRCFRGQTAKVCGAALSADGRRLLSGAWDRTVLLWDVESGKELRRLDKAGDVTSVALSADGRRALIGTYEGLTRWWDVDNWEELRRFESTRGVWSVALSPDGRYALVAGGTEGPNNRATLQLWDLKEGKDLGRFEEPKNRGIWRAVFSPNGDQVLSAGADGYLRLWDVATGKELRSFRGHRGEVSGAAFSPDGGRALSGGYDGTVRLWDLASGQELGLCGSRARREVRGVAFSPDGRHALSGSADGSVWLSLLPAVEDAKPEVK